jgi:F-type H+-transporting ATPase subunit epsilon
MSFKVDILTPTKVLVKGMEASSLFVPTEKGELNILPEHTALLSKLDVGLLSVMHDGGKEVFVVNKGICKVEGKRVLILANEALKKGHLTLDKVKEEYSKASESLSGRKILDDLEFQMEQQRLRLAEAKLSLLQS